MWLLHMYWCECIYTFMKNNLFKSTQNIKYAIVYGKACILSGSLLLFSFSRVSYFSNSFEKYLLYFTHFLSAVCLKAVPESPYFLVHMCHPLDLITVISSQFLPNMLSISNLMLVFCKLYFLFIIKLRNLDLWSLNIVCWNRYEHDLIKTENRRDASMCAC